MKGSETAHPHRHSEERTVRFETRARLTLWNTVYLGRALDVLQGRGGVVPDELLAHIAPLGWQHINLTGDYLWTVDPQPGPDGLRPLRSTAEASLPARAAWHRQVAGGGLAVADRDR